MTHEIKAFIFDLDGVITDTAEFHYLAWRKLADSLGICFDRSFNEQLKGISRMESLEMILNYGNKPNLYSESEKVELAEKKNRFYLELIKDITSENTLPGIKTLLEKLKKEEIKVGLASASKNAKTIINRLELSHYFDCIVDSAKIEKGKPNPEIFLEATRQLKLLPQECIGVEDAAAGVQAIKAANMTAIGVGNDEILKQADLVVETTEELVYEKLIAATVIENFR
jgi:beta-phosphoglucomutase